MNGTLTTDLRLLRLERRVERIERRLSLEATTDVADPDSAEPEATTATQAPTIPAEGTGPLVDMPTRMAPRPVTPPPLPPTPPPEAAPEAAPVALSYVPSVAAPQAMAQTPAKSSQLEQTIGLKWAGWIGAIVLVIGAILGVKFAYENGWLGHVPPVLRFAMIVAAGGALLGAGEFVFRRINVISAASLFGGGVATLFVATYVGHAYYDLYPRTAAMTLMALSTLLGALVAMRGNLVSIAVLSLVGANVAPVMVATPDAPVLPFLFYLLAIQLVAITLASWGRGGKWWTLRGLSLGSSVLWMAGVLASPHAHDGVVLVFVIAYAALYHLELIVSTIRESKATQTSTAGSYPGVAFSLFVTAGLTLALLTFFAEAPHDLRARATLELAAACSMLGFLLPRLNARLRRLALAHRVAAAALIALAVPIATDGQGLDLGWMALALAFAMTWAFTRAPISRFAAPVVWTLAVGHMAAQWFPDAEGAVRAGEVLFTFRGMPIVSHLILACGSAFVGNLIARLILIHRAEQAERGWMRAMRAISIAAGALWIGGAILFLPPVAATVVIALYAWLLIATDPLAPQLRFSLQTMFALALAAAKWAVIDGLANRLAPGWSAGQYLPVFNPLMGAGALVAASFVGLYGLRRRSLRDALKRGNDGGSAFGLLAMAALVIGMMTIGLTFEVDRVVERALNAGRYFAWPAWQAKQLAWTMLWSAAVMMLALAARFLAEERSCRSVWLSIAWLFAGMLMLKYFALDTLWYRLHEAGGRAIPLANLQMLAGCAVVACLVVVRKFGAPRAAADPKQTGTLRSMRGGIGVLVLMMIAWMGTFEIDRAVMRGTFSGVLSLAAGGAEEAHLRQLLWTCWWCACAAGGFVLGCRRDQTAPASESWIVWMPVGILLVAIKYLLVDIAAWRALHRAVPWMILVNPEALAAGFVLAGLILLRLMQWPHDAKPRAAVIARWAATLVVIVLLCAGTVEVDRSFTLPSVRASLADAGLAEQVALSIFWSVFAVTSVAVGFRIRAAGLRYSGLALLAVTLLKVVTVDLGQVSTGYRILSFLGLGMLLLGTSVLYGKVSPKLLREPVSADNT